MVTGNWKIKKRFWVLLLLFTSYQSPVTGSLLHAASWNELKGDHFIVYYEKDEAFAKQVVHSAETYYGRIADDLGYPRYSNFWQWDNRVKIYIYGTVEAFRKGTGEAEWSHGVAMYSKKEIRTYQSSDGFLDGILPHEITHLIFRDFVGLTGRVPIWIDEGVAQWEEPAKRALAIKVARWLIHTDKDLLLQDLTAKDPRAETDPEVVQHYYMQAISLVDYLIRKAGGKTFTEFCRALRDGKSLEEALRTTYRIETQWDLQEQWKKDVMGQPVTDELEVYART